MIQGVSYALFEDRVLDPGERPDAQPQRRGVQDRRIPRLSPRSRRSSFRSGRASTTRSRPESASRPRSRPPPPSPTPSRTPSGAPITPSSRRSRRRSCSPPWTRLQNGEGRPVMKPFTLVHAKYARRGLPRVGQAGHGAQGRGRRPARPHEGRLRQPEGRRLDRRRRGPRSHRGRPSGEDRGARHAGLDRRQPRDDQALPRAGRRGRRRRDAPDPQHGDARRQPLPEAPLLVLPPRGVRLPQEGRRGLLRARRARTASTRSSTRTFSAAAFTRRRPGRRSPPTARTLEVVSAKGKRSLPIDKFFYRPTEDPKVENTLVPGEIVESVVDPAPRPRGRGRSTGSSRRRSRSTGRSSRPPWCCRSREARSRTRASSSARSRPMPYRSQEARSRPQRREARAGDREARGRGGGPGTAKPLSQNAYKVRLARVELERALREAFA